ncbi:MAG TPA: hypothetical protein VF602_09045 [Pedobacter sp.]|jgi:hypothetical protein
MEEMSLIRKELKAIGININQRTKYFHTSQSSAERAFYVMKTADLYKKADEKVDPLLIIISKLAERWLSPSQSSRRIVDPPMRSAGKPVRPCFPHPLSCKERRTAHASPYFLPYRNQKS